MRLVEVENVTKTYRARMGANMLLRGGGFAQLIRRGKQRTFEALRNISFTVDQGESLGIIGSNGSGKSTLLKILAGVTVPTKGRVRVRGRVVSLLELGAGFHHLLSGRENLYLNARILGMGRTEIEAAYQDIVAFSGIDAFIDNPVSTYSSGMYVRLGFAVAVHANPDLFLVDEVLSVGDEEFQRKCRNRIMELKEQGKTIVFVSHDLNIVNTLCDRVILLSKGDMVVRRTTRETIDFYLRQVGQQRGIHRFEAGDLEVVLNHGRLSVFRAGREVTAPAGMQVRLQCMEQWQDSSSAEWEIVDRRPDGCSARGRMGRLPLSHIWDLRIEDGRLIWQVALECEHEVAIQEYSADVTLPMAYAEWAYGDHTGAFPEILPSDTGWTMIVPPDPMCRDAAAWSPQPENHPPLSIHLEAHRYHPALAWSNTDFAKGVRVLQATGRIPEMESPIPAGRHELMTLTLDLQTTVEEVRERARQREEEQTLRCGLLAARFDRGSVRLAAGGREISSFVHLYSSMLIGNLWNDSLALRWEKVDKRGPLLEATGVSRRFPFSQEWRLEATEEGLALEIWLIALQPIEATEYQVSVGLCAAYDRWETEHETAAFPPFDPQSTDWSHANRDYAPGSFIRALSSSLPGVRLGATATGLSFRMTAINTAYQEQTRVIQALRTPDAGNIRFEEGRHLYFAGLVSVDPPEDS